MICVQTATSSHECPAVTVHRTLSRWDDPTYSTIPDKDAEWTDTEVLLLLEGLEMFDSNWTEISNHVGTRTREECVMKFLQLDIQDQFMDDGVANGSSSLRSLGGRDPISQAENPVMSVVSFLAQMADPKVVAAASQRSVEQLQKESKSNIEKGIGGTEESSKEKSPTKEGEDLKAETGDSMDVDDATNATEQVQPANGTSKICSRSSFARTLCRLIARLSTRILSRTRTHTHRWCRGESVPHQDSAQADSIRRT